MKDDIIPDEDHIARYCKPSKIGEDGQIEFGAFMLRKDGEGLSVNWLEYLRRSSRGSEIAELRRVYAAKLSVGARAMIAVLNVGEIHEIVLTEILDRKNIEILHDPEINDPSHSGIYNLKQEDELIAELILQTIRETYPARA